MMTSGDKPQPAPRKGKMMSYVMNLQSSLGKHLFKALTYIYSAHILLGILTCDTNFFQEKRSSTRNRLMMMVDSQGGGLLRV